MIENKELCLIEAGGLTVIPVEEALEWKDVVLDGFSCLPNKYGVLVREAFCIVEDI